MALDFFNNMASNDIIQPYNNYYRDLQQAFIEDQWDNTTAVKVVQEQDMTEDRTFPNFTFHKTEAWVNYVVGMTTTMKKNGDDFTQLIFKCLTHPCVRGRYYKFDNNYWIGDFTNQYDGIVANLSVRRCNNTLRMIDPMNGGIYSIPCVVDYDMMSPSIQVSKSVITPNNHARIVVQANPTSNRLFKTNTRYIIGGRPFKLYAYQDAILDDETSPEPTLLYLDMYLDEIHANDDLENQLAFNGRYDYQVRIHNGNIEVGQNTKGVLSADVLLNGEEVQRPVVWSSSNPSLVNIDENGEYITFGINGEVEITASLEDNTNVMDKIIVKVVEVPVFSGKIVIDPTFEKLREGESITTKMSVLYENKVMSPTLSNISLSDTESVLENKFVKITKLGNDYVIKCLNRSPDEILLYLTAENTSPDFSIKQTMKIKLTSLFG